MRMDRDFDIARRCRSPVPIIPRGIEGLIRVLIALLLACVMAPASAQERILRHDVDARILADGRIDVTERIELRAEGRIFRHGLVRDFPLRGRGLDGEPLVAEVQIRDVLRDGRAEPWRVERVGDVLRLHTGDARHLPMPSQPVYTLHYRSARQIVFGETQDAVTLAAMGTGHQVPVEQATVSLTLPAPVEVGSLRAEGVTGAGGRDLHVALSATGQARWTLTRPLPAHTGLRVRLAFPKGIVAAPEPRQQAIWWLRDHSGLVLALAGWLVLAIYCVRRWQRVRQPLVYGVVPLRDEPPAGFSPAGLRYIRRMRYDARTFAADLLASAVDDHLRLQRTPQGARTGWRIERTREGAQALPTLEQRALVSALLPEARDTVELRRHASARIAQAWKAHETALRRRFQPALFRAHRGAIVGALAIAVASAGPALWFSRHAPSLPATLLVIASMAPVLLVLVMLVREPTAEGRKLLAHAEGLRRSMASAAKGARRDAAGATAPLLDAARYARLLPYAVALDVEDAWTSAFAASVGAPAARKAVAGFSWYRGITVTDLGRFSRSMGDSLSARLAAVVHPRRRRHGETGGARAAGEDTGQA
ncbi:hypothetical protein CNR27_12945 [Luteimonas chenhongjianii]|uniref:DUF2207 domain-containing protein n=1 Tax=Luteimonas chenhongjianii TaxID=2006110 RepID=A0A290XGE5_9GAMM|nr:hypothetical protein CNR27_12945 [Luteimonas chenhongjianii]